MFSNGVDLVKTDRFLSLKDNDKFMESCFTKNELTYIKKCNNSISTIAGIYASKEAFLKAIKKGINNYSLKDIEISHNDNNDPFIILHNDLKDISINNISLSISHDGDYAIAMVSIFF